VHALLISMALASAPAHAGAWSDFEAVFATLPCHDGWAGCVVEGEQVGPDMVQGSDGVPMPSGMRLDWFTLEGTTAVSPFVGLSDYPTALAQVAPTPQPRVERTQPVAQAPEDTGDDQPVRTPPDRGNPARDVPSNPQPVADAGSYQPAQVDPQPVRDDPAVAQTDPQPVGPRLPPAQILPAGTTQDAVAQADPVEPDPVQPEPVQPEPAQVETVSNDAVVDVAPVVEVDDSCDDLVALEPAALMGQLSNGQIECLEARIVSTSRMTEKDKVSRVLIMDAETKGNRAKWEALMKRHLEEIDRSDPDLCFKYAVFLSRKGVGRAHGVIRWADYALENKSRWSGGTFVSRVYALNKLKAEGANRIWQSAEEAYVADRSDENEAKAQKYRDLTKVYAREWLDYARSSSQDTKNAMALCVSAAGNRQYCEGG